MSARSLTKQQMIDLAYRLLEAEPRRYPMKVRNPNVFWEAEVDRYRRRVIVRGNFLEVMNVSRSQLVFMAQYRGIAC